LSHTIGERDSKPLRSCPKKKGGKASQPEGKKEIEGPSCEGKGMEVLNISIWKEKERAESERKGEERLR